VDLSRSLYGFELEGGVPVFQRLRSFLAVFCLLALSAQPALASVLAKVTSITGSAFVMRGNKVEKLYLGAKIEKGDRVIVAAGGRVILSGGTVIGPGASAVAKGSSGIVQITTTSTTSASAPKSNSSKLFSDKKGSKKKDEDDDEDDKEDDEYGDPDDPDAVSY
jgi:hypothetical protein